MAGKLSAVQYSEALFELGNKYPDFGENAEEVREQVLALLAAERAAKKASAALDEFNNPKPKTPITDTPTSLGGSDDKAGLSDKDQKRIDDRIAGLQAEEKALRRLMMARREGGDAMHMAMVANKQADALRRVGIDTTKTLTDEQKQYAEQIRSLVSRIYVLGESEKTHEQALRDKTKAMQEQQALLQNVSEKYNALDTSLQGAIERAKRWRDETLAGLNEAHAGYDEFAKYVDAIYADMIAQVREQDLQNSKRWQDGVARGLQSVQADALDMANQTENMVRKSFNGMEDALVSFVQTGKLDFKSLADSIIADLIRMQVRSAITVPLSGALSGMMSGMFGTAHTGAVIGDDTLQTRMVNPMVFANAPRFHGGGLVGGEVPIIAKEGETVFTPGQMKLLGGALNAKPSVNVNVRVNNTVSDAQARAEVYEDSSGNIDLRVMVEELEGTMARHIDRGEGLSSVLERRYGLNPAVGSYG